MDKRIQQVTPYTTTIGEAGPFISYFNKIIASPSDLVNIETPQIHQIVERLNRAYKAGYQQGYADGNTLYRINY